MKPESIQKVKQTKDLVIKLDFLPLGFGRTYSMTSVLPLSSVLLVCCVTPHLKGCTNAEHKSWIPLKRPGRCSFFFPFIFPLIFSHKVQKTEGKQFLSFSLFFTAFVFRRSSRWKTGGPFRSFVGVLYTLRGANLLCSAVASLFCLTWHRWVIIMLAPQLMSREHSQL